jgi:short subunit dehydrogenase-like uncharacterized protein
MIKNQLLIIVYGATGFTGKLVSSYLNTHPELKDKSWAIAGRTKSKLKTLSTELSDKPETICVDLENIDEVSVMVKRAKVVLNCAGPYSTNNGTNLLGACAREGTHYSDLSGEGFWQAEMVEMFHKIACNSGSKIILGGGVDSIPSDLGVFLAKKKLEQKSEDNIEISGVYTRYTGSFSGGTLNSGKASAKARELGKFTDLMANNPYLLTPLINGIETENPGTADGMNSKFKSAFDYRYGVITKFFMAPINARIVRRSLTLQNQHNKISYKECASIGMWIHLIFVWISSGFGYFLGEPIKMKPKSGEGPPKWLLKSGSFKIEITAKTKSKKIRTKISGKGDPGYGATSKMLAELGLCLALDDHSNSSNKAGILTPSTGLGDALIYRLSNAQKGKFMHFN